MILPAVAVLAGTLLACLPAILPGLHIYNIMGLAALFLCSPHGTEFAAVPQGYVPFLIGLVTGWSVLSTVPGVLFAASDESAVLTVLPGQKYLMTGRGYESVMIIGAGSLAGLFILIFLIGPSAPKFLPAFLYVITPHMHWILWVVIAFILITEWPQGGHRGPAGWRRFFEAWSTLGAGLLVFLLSGLLGFLLLYRSPVPVESAFQNLMPALAGLFALPWCLLNAISGVEMPEQTVCGTLDINGDLLLRGVVVGGLGGGFAAVFPVVTGGIGGLLAGHAAAQRDERAFLLSQGVSKTVYYAGALLFFFTPGLHLTRGGGAWILQGLYNPSAPGDWFLAFGSVALSGGVSFLLLSPLAKGTLALIKRVSYRRISVFALTVMMVLVFAVTGRAGLLIMTVAAGIGLLPALSGSRRLNCLGVLLLPAACNMSGIGEPVAAFLGLLGP